jgi:hypothetical protein
MEVKFIHAQKFSSHDFGWMGPSLLKKMKALLLILDQWGLREVGGI